MSARYQIKVRDTSGALVAILTDWVSLDYTLKVNGVDEHKLVLNADSVDSSQWPTDALIEVQRQDLTVSPVLDWTTDYEGFHRDPFYATLESGEEQFTSTGRGFTNLLERRFIMYPPGSSGSDKSGVGETVIKEYVDDNAGPSATYPSRVRDGVTSGLTIPASTGLGSSWQGSHAEQNLFDVVAEIAKGANLAFKVIGDTPASFLFIVRSRPWGVDRSSDVYATSTGLNAAGNIPVVFALNFGNMQAPSYEQKRIGEANTIYVLGQGIDSNREIVLAEDTTASGASPWNQCEAIRQADSSTGGLEAAGAAALMELAARETFHFGVLQTPHSIYGRDYSLGDLVTAKYRDYTANLEITEVNVSVANGEERVQITVGPVTP